MPSVTLLLSAALALGTAVGFALVGRVLAARERSRDGQRAQVMFILFWASAAVIWTTQGLANLAGGLGRASQPLLEALDQVSTPFYCLAAAGLLYYVLYLVTGRTRLLGPILAYYLVLFALLRWRVESADRVGVTLDDWAVGFEYATPLRGPLYTLLVALLSGPLLASLLVYAALWLRVRDPLARYRIALVSVGLFAWVGVEALTFILGYANTTGGELTRRLVALAGTGLVLLAYRPPRSVERRLAERALA